MSARGINTDMCQPMDTEDEEEQDSVAQVRFVEKKPCCSCCRGKGKGCLHHLILILLFVGMVVGIGIGIVLRNVHPFDQPKLHPKAMMYLMFPGELLLRCMMLLCLPLVVTSLIAGVASLDAKTSGKIGLRTMTYYVSTTIIAVAEGFLFVKLIKPGSDIKIPNMEPFFHDGYSNIDAVLDMFR